MVDESDFTSLPISIDFSIPRCAVFVHQSAIQSTGFRFLKEGERVREGY